MVVENHVPHCQAVSNYIVQLPDPQIFHTVSTQSADATAPTVKDLRKCLGQSWSSQTPGENDHRSVGFGHEKHVATHQSTAEHVH